MSKLLYVSDQRHPEELKNFIKSKIKSSFPNFDQAFYSDDEQILVKKFGMADVVFMAPGRYLSDEVHKAGVNIKLIQLWSSGYDKINMNACNKFNQKVANNGGANAQSVAEHTILLMLSAARRLTEMHNRVILGNWDGNGHGLNLQSLFGKSLGIIGMGNIGSKVAEIALTFKMQITYFDPFVELKNNMYLKKVNLEELVKNSDFISLHVHYDKNSKPILGDQQFKMMKPGVNIINTARAELIDYVALIKSLESGKVRYYASDVFLNEPTSGNELEFISKNTTFTPHIGGSNVETYEIALNNCLANINRALNNHEIYWLV